ncbi:MAG: hypothetical protein QXZ59_03865 [Nitrososphaeria archaeon]
MEIESVRGSRKPPAKAGGSSPIASLYILIPVIVNVLVFERLRKKILISQEVSETVYFSR